MPRARAHLLTLAAAALAGVAALAGCSVDSSVSRALGARCDSSADCDDRCLAPGAAFPGGFCSLSCDASAGCPGGASCADVEGGVCLFECDADARCELLGAGWRCQEVSQHGGAAGTVQVCLGG